MSTINYVNKNNLPTSEVLADEIRETSMDILKKVRFDVGCKPSVFKMQELLRMERLICSEYCYVSSEDSDNLRKQIIQQSILRIREL